MLSTREFAKARGYSESFVKRLAKERRLEGARKRAGKWEIPAASRKLPPKNGAGRRQADAPYEGISVAEYASAEGITPQRVRQLLAQERIEGAVMTERGWDIPRGARRLPTKLQRHAKRQDKRAG